jgi:hypothetical protein
MTSVSTDATAWVESPFQLIGALEAHAAGLLGTRLDVVPRAGIDSLAMTIAELQRLGLPRGVEVRPAATRPPRQPGLVAFGDAFSGQVQRLLATKPPVHVVLLDDGRATWRMLDALTLDGVPLLRPHVVASPPRALLARVALARLQRQARWGWVDVVTALDVPAALLERCSAAGLRVNRHEFGWLRSLPSAGVAAVSSRQPTVVLGTSMVANGLIAAEPYLAWVRSIVAASPVPVSYLAHRREDSSTLQPLAAAGLEVRSGSLPVEVTLRDLRPGQDVVTLPSTAASTLRMLSPQARIREYAVPESWWLPSTPAAARRRLVPDESAGPAAPWFRVPTMLTPAVAS